MHCAEVRERLMTVEPSALNRTAASPMGRHLARCPACARAADSILAANDALDIGLASVAPPDVERVLHDAGVRPARRGELRRGAALAALLAAAAVGGILLGDFSDPPVEGGVPVSLEVPRYDVPAERNLLVLPTRNPKITVLWLF